VIINFRIKQLFFDQPKVANAVDRARRQVLIEAGAGIRRTARASIRKHKGKRNRNVASKPGEPPFSHTGLLRRFILFGYDNQSKSVVVGPLRLHGSVIAEVLEHGGTATVTRVERGRRVRRRVRIAALPYMNPALDKELPKFPELWRESIKRA